jgi:6-phosphogluconolactonase
MRPNLAIDRFEDAEAGARAAADCIAKALGDALAARGAAGLAATGGRSPRPVYAALAARPLAWAQVSVTLSDERWVDEDHPDSNARLVRESLLVGPAAAARFIGFKTAAARPEEAVDEVERRLAGLPWPLDAVMLGMAEDGHVASLFPRNAALTAAMATGSTRRCAAMAVGPDGMPPLQPRMSLTLAAIDAARQVLIYITGADKWRALQAALGGGDAMEMPVRAVLTGPAPMRVIWAP